MSIRNSYSPAPALQTSYMCEKWKIRWNYVKKYLIFFEFIKAKATRVNTSHPIEGRRFAQLTASRFTYFFLSRDNWWWIWCWAHLVCECNCSDGCVVQSITRKIVGPIFSIKNNSGPEKSMRKGKNEKLYFVCCLHHLTSDSVSVHQLFFGASRTSHLLSRAYHSSAAMEFNLEFIKFNCNFIQQLLRRI